MNPVIAEARRVQFARRRRRARTTVLWLLPTVAIVGAGYWAFATQSRRTIYEGPEGGIPSGPSVVYVQTNR
jgi:hypothetical protein